MAEKDLLYYNTDTQQYESPYAKGSDITQLAQTVSNLVQTTNQKIEEVNTSLSKIEVNAFDFGAKGDALFFNSADNKFYADSSFTIPSNNDRQSINDAITFVNSNGGGIVKLSGKHLIDFEQAPDNVFGVEMKDNVTLVFENQAELFGASTAVDHYVILDIYNAKNVKIINPKITGDKMRHLGSTGEWGYGISITHSTDVEIISPEVNDCWGDGIYIGNRYFSGINTINENIFISDATINNARRNGISVTTGNLIKIIRPNIKNTGGTAPGAGIDIEPEGDETQTKTVNNLFIENAFTSNNQGAAILLAPSGTTNGSEMNIKIDNHVDNASAFGFNVVVAQTPDLELKGIINITNPIWRNNKNSGLYLGRYYTTLPFLKVVNPYIENWNTENTQVVQAQSAISIHDEFIPQDVPMGNIEISGPSLFKNIETPGKCFYLNPSGTGGFSKTSIINPDTLDVVKSNKAAWLGNGVRFLDINETLENEANGAPYYRVIRGDSLVSKTTNINSTEATTIDLISAPIGFIVIFELELSSTEGTNDKHFNIKPADGEVIFPYDANNQSFSSGTKGSRLVFKRVDGGWLLLEKIGPWVTFQ